MYRDEQSAKNEQVDIDDEENDDSTAPDRKSSEDSEIETLAEAIEVATKASNGMADAGGSTGEADATSEASTVDDSEASTNETGVGGLEGSNCALVAKSFQKLLLSESLDDITSACEGGMSCLTMKRRES